MKDKLQKILKVISSIIFVVLIIIIVLFAVYILGVKYLEKENRLDEVPINFYTILTQSMYPKIKAGDIIITYQNKDDKYKVGDIITYVSSNKSARGLTITHRVTEVLLVNDEYVYKTKGDNNNAGDSGTVPENDVMGKYIFKIPKAGYIQQFLVTRFGWITAIVLPCLGVIIYDIIKVFKIVVNKSKKSKFIVEDDRFIEAKEQLNNVINDNVLVEETNNTPVVEEVITPTGPVEILIEQPVIVEPTEILEQSEVVETLTLDETPINNEEKVVSDEEEIL